uniref:helix-turn-helix domain-containing protein n=1 Tax=Acetatifactor sp. TaxID=1872090 RepID=UPI004057034F
MMLISDAAKEVNVENHVLRYWEEELHLPIKRNELGHRYYTEEDVERFKQIKSMKERGLQLKAIKMILKNGNIEQVQDMPIQDMPIQIVENQIMEKHEGKAELIPEKQEEKSRRLQWLLQQLIRETLEENNQLLCREIKESVIKELDYQFRIQEEREEERDRKMEQRNEEYYKRMDELLRKKSKRFLRDEEKIGVGSLKKEEKSKKKKHSVF